MSQPVLTEKYKGFTISVWPQIDLKSPFYAIALQDNSPVYRGLGGISGNTPQQTLEAARRWIDDRTR